MNDSTNKIRLMQADDFDAVVGIDEKVLKASRPEYYEENKKGRAKMTLPK
jgi:hypothetical protein